MFGTIGEEAVIYQGRDSFHYQTTEEVETPATNPEMQPVSSRVGEGQSKGIAAAKPMLAVFTTLCHFWYCLEMTQR